MKEVNNPTYEQHVGTLPEHGLKPRHADGGMPYGAIQVGDLESSYFCDTLDNSPYDSLKDSENALVVCKITSGRFESPPCRSKSM